MLLSPSNPSQRPLEASKLLLTLARRAAKGTYSSVDGKSPYHLLGEWLDLCDKYADDVGISPEEADEAKAAADTLLASGSSTSAVAVRQPPAGSVRAMTAQESAAYDAATDPASAQKLDVEKIVREEGLALYKDQAGRLWTGLAQYWIKKGELSKVSTFTSPN